MIKNDKLLFSYEKYELLCRYFNFKPRTSDYHKVLKNYFQNCKSGSYFGIWILNNLDNIFLISIIDSVSKYFQSAVRYNFIIHSILVINETNINFLTYNKFKKTNIFYICLLAAIEFIKIPLGYLVMIILKIMYKFDGNYDSKNFNDYKFIIIGGTSGFANYLAFKLANYGKEVLVLSKNKNTNQKYNAQLKMLSMSDNLLFDNLDLNKKLDSNKLNLKKYFNKKKIMIFYNAAVKSKNLEESFNVNYFSHLKILEYISSNFPKIHKTHIFISSLGKYTESFFYPYYNSSKAALSSTISSFKFSNKQKKQNFLLIEPSMIESKMIKKTNLTKYFIISQEKASNKIFKFISLNFNKNKKYILGKKFLFIILILKILPIKLKMKILEKNSHS